MMKVSPLVLAVVAMIASSASGFVPSNRMLSTANSVRSTEKKLNIESILKMSDDDVSHGHL